MNQASVEPKTKWVRAGLAGCALAIGVAAAPDGAWLVLDRSVLVDDCLAAADGQVGCVTPERAYLTKNPSASTALLAPDGPNQPARLLTLDIPELLSFGPEVTESTAPRKLAAVESAGRCALPFRHRPDRAACAKQPLARAYRAGSVKVKRAP